MVTLMRSNLWEVFPKEGRYYIPKEECLGRLRKWSGRDFGDDIAAWDVWIDRYEKGLETANGPQVVLVDPLP